MKSKFYKIYFTVICVFVLLIVAFLFFLGSWLKGFESTQPETMVNSIIEEYLKSDNFYRITDMTDLSVSPYESKENINNFIINEVKDKKITTSSTASKIEGCDVAYTIKADDKKLLTVYFKKIEDSSQMFNRYEIMSAAFDSSLFKSVTVTMPEKCEIKVNGIEFNKENIKTLSLPEIPKNYKSENLKTDSFVTIDKLLSDQPLIEASQNGVKLEVFKKDTQYRVADYINDSLSDRLSSFAVDASKTYSSYMQLDANLEDIKKYFATDTDFYTNLRTSLVIFALDHESFSFEDVKVHSIHKFSDNLYSCHVSMTQVLVRNGNDYRDYYNKNVFICVNGDKMSVINLQSTDEK